MGICEVRRKDDGHWTVLVSVRPSETQDCPLTTRVRLTQRRKRICRKVDKRVRLSFNMLAISGAQETFVNI